MGLRDKYAHAIATAKGKFHGGAEERDGKLYWKGTVATEAEKNEIWDAIKTVSDWRNDIVAEITVTGPPAGAAAVDPRSAPGTAPPHRCRSTGAGPRWLAGRASRRRRRSE